MDGNDNTPIVSIKKAVIRALRTTFDDQYPVEELRGIHVDMEYPGEAQEYPGIWVQFSFRKLQIVGIGSEFHEDGDVYKMWSFDGTVTLTNVALSSKERDMAADALIHMFAFHQLNHLGNRFQRSLSDWPYINMTINSDQLNTGGQSVTVGTPWMPDQLAYEDSYSFDLIGQYKSSVSTNELAILSEIKVTADIVEEVSGIPLPPYEDGNGEWK